MKTIETKMTVSELREALKASRAKVRLHFTAKGNPAWKCFYRYGKNDREIGTYRLTKKEANEYLAEFGLTANLVIEIEKALADAQDAKTAAMKASGELYTGGRDCHKLTNDEINAVYAKFATADAETEKEQTEMKTNEIKIETRISANGAAIIHVNGKRTSNEKAVEIAMENGLPYYSAKILTSEGNAISKEFVAIIAAYKWIRQQTKKNQNANDGSEKIIRYGNEIVKVYEDAGRRTECNDAELQNYIDAVNAKEHIESAYRNAQRFVNFYVEQHDLTVEQAEQIFAAVNADNADNKAVKEMIANFKSATTVAEAEIVQAANTVEIETPATVAEPEIAKFEAGKTYATKKSVLTNLQFTITVLKRTPKFVTFQFDEDEDDIRKRKVTVEYGVEKIYIHETNTLDGDYEFSANDVVDEPEAAATVAEIDAAEYAISEDAFNFAVEYEIEEAAIVAGEARAIARILANETLKIRYDKAKTQVKYERYENGYCGWYFKGKNRDNWECNVTKATACLTRYGLSRFEFAILSENEPAVIDNNGYDETAFDLLPTVDELNDIDDAAETYTLTIYTDVWTDGDNTLVKNYDTCQRLHISGKYLISKHSWKLTRGGKTIATGDGVKDFCHFITCEFDVSERFAEIADVKSASLEICGENIWFRNGKCIFVYSPKYHASFYVEAGIDGNEHYEINKSDERGNFTRFEFVTEEEFFNTIERRGGCTVDNAVGYDETAFDPLPTVDELNDADTGLPPADGEVEYMGDAQAILVATFIDGTSEGKCFETADAAIAFARKCEKDSLIKRGYVMGDDKHYGNEIIYEFNKRTPKIKQAAATVTEIQKMQSAFASAIEDSNVDFSSTLTINGETLTFEEGQLSEIASTRYGAYFKIRNGRKIFYYRGNRVSKQDFFAHIATEDKAVDERAKVAQFVAKFGGSEIKPGTNPQANFVAQIHPILANGRQDSYHATFANKVDAHAFINEFKTLAGGMKFLATIKRGSFFGETIYRHGLNGQEFFAPDAEPELDEDEIAEKFYRETESTFREMKSAVAPARKFMREHIFDIYHFDYVLTIFNQRGELKAYPNKFHLVDTRFDIEVDRCELDYVIYFGNAELARYRTVENVNRAVDQLAIAIANRRFEFTFPEDAIAPIEQLARGIERMRELGELDSTIDDANEKARLC